jgi:hypothetical protein
MFDRTGERPGSLLRRASTFDLDIVVPRTASLRLTFARRQVHPTSFGVPNLWRAMISGQPQLWTDVPTGLAMGQEDVVRLLQRTLPAKSEVAAQVSLRKPRHSTTLDWVMRRWSEDRRTASTTDLHFRGTKLVRLLRSEGISAFNMLAPPGNCWMEMLTLVLSTTGNVTDSHSDDCDVINHAILGSKLWLVWDRLEGALDGLQDVSYDDVRDRAFFNLGRFLRLRSSRWALVKPNQTFFLPGNFTHRVITLERYFGFGSFCVGLPSWPRTLARWLTAGTSYSDPNRVRSVIRRVNRRASAIAKDPGQRLRYGWEAARVAVEEGERCFPARVRAHPDYLAFKRRLTSVPMPLERRYPLVQAAD